MTQKIIEVQNCVISVFLREPHYLVHVWAFFKDFGFLLKYRFCKKLLLLDCNSDQLNILIPVTKTLERHSFHLKKVSLKYFDYRKIFDEKSSTGQSCIRKEVTSYKFQTSITESIKSVWVTLSVLSSCKIFEPARFLILFCSWIKFDLVYFWKIIWLTWNEEKIL